MEYGAPPPPLRACDGPASRCALFLFAGGHSIP
nr:MAG TPA: hypothetical protein [Caudoviricetes sp.]